MYPNYGQIPDEQLDTVADSRGVMPKAVVTRMRDKRSREQWTRYDSIVIGVGSSRLSRGFYESWADFANADRLLWFSGRDGGAGSAFTNQTTERTDWAQDLYQTRVEFVTPPGMGQLETEPTDAEIAPILFAQALPSSLALSVTLAESDEIARAPAVHFPSGLGNAFPVVSAAAAPTVIPGTNGEPHISNSWKWPEPITLAAKSKLTVSGLIDQPIRAALQNLPGPGFKRIPIGGGLFYDLPNWYVLRISFVGPRYLQLRGARSSS